MPIQSALNRIEKNFEMFESSLEKFGKHATMLAKTSIKSEVAAFKKIEKERSVIALLKNDVAHKKKYSDINVDGIHHLESEIARREKMLAHDEQEFLFGNSFMKSHVGFENELLAKAGLAARELHNLSTTIQLQIRGLIEFAEEELGKGKKEFDIDKLGLYKKSLMLAQTNSALLQNMVYLSNMKLDSSASLENYHYEKSRILSEAKNIIELDESAIKDVLKEFASYNSGDLARTNSLR